MPVSSKDKLRVNLAAKRVERWNRERCKPANNDTKRCEGIQWSPNQDKPALVYADKSVIASDAVKMRSSADKVAREMRRNGDTFIDYQDAGYSELPRDAVKVTRSYRARPDSPFKRAAKAASAVVIVRK